MCNSSRTDTDRIFFQSFCQGDASDGGEGVLKVGLRGKEDIRRASGRLGAERDEDEFMAMYEQYEEFDDLEEQFMDMEEEVTEQVARYVDEHLDQFAEISA